MVQQELAHADGSVSTFYGVQSGLAMPAIGMVGSEDQKQRFFPGMATLEKIGHNATRACAPIGDARDQLRGDGILLDGHVARHQADMESVVTYEGTDAIQA